MSIEILDILTLSNKKDYMVVSKIIYNDFEYVLLNEVDKNEEMLNESIILKVIKEENDIIFDEIKSSEELEKVVKQFENL